MKELLKVWEIKTFTEESFYGGDYTVCISVFITDNSEKLILVGKTYMGGNHPIACLEDSGSYTLAYDMIQKLNN